MNKLSFMSGSGTFQGIIIILGREGVRNYSYMLTGKVETEENEFLQMDT